MADFAPKALSPEDCGAGQPPCPKHPRRMASAGDPGPESFADIAARITKGVTP